MTCQHCSQPLPEPGRAYCDTVCRAAAKYLRRARRPEPVALDTTPQACAYCREIFSPTSPGQRFCKPTHAKRSRLVRKGLTKPWPRPVE